MPVYWCVVALEKCRSHLTVSYYDTACKRYEHLWLGERRKGVTESLAGGFASGRRMLKDVERCSG